MTRAVLAVGRADLAEAWRFHPAVYVVVAQFAVFTALSLAGRPAGLRGWFTSDRATWLLGTNSLVLIVVWMIRWRTGAIPIE
jgi:hypothetical protein